MEKTFKVRAHHGMCLAYFIGEGYSTSFVGNMWTQKRFLENENPMIEIVCAQDHICAKCPNNEDGHCTSIDKVQDYDQKVLEICNLKEHDIMSWKEYSNLVHDKVLNAGKRKDICKNCSWNSICEAISETL